MARDKGVYVLLIEVAARVNIGCLRSYSLDGVYLYVGSALGVGGFKRVDRHIQVAQGKNPTQRWHVDYLLKAGKLKSAFVASTDGKIECELAQKLSKRTVSAIPDFGASDCGCKTHLFKTKLPKVSNSVFQAMRECGLKPRKYYSDEKP